MPATAPDPTGFPARHAMRLLALESEQTADGDLRGWLRVAPELRAPSGGPRLAAVAMLVDSLGGARSITAAAPDWALTADLTVHLLPVGEVSELQVDVHVRRRGRRTLVLEMDLTADGATPAGLATSTFAVVPRPAHLEGLDIDRSPGRRAMSAPEPGEAPLRPYLEELGAVEHGPGRVVLELRPEVANRFGALHGGVHTALADEASASLGRSLLGGEAETTDVHLAFLEPARTGPVHAEAALVGDPAPDGSRLTAEVRVIDHEGRLCSYATTEVVAP